MGARQDGSLVTRGLFIGDHHDCFEKACELSVQVNFTKLDEPLDKVVVYLDPKNFTVPGSETNLFIEPGWLSLTKVN